MFVMPPKARQQLGVFSWLYATQQCPRVGAQQEFQHVTGLQVGQVDDNPVFLKAMVGVGHFPCRRNKIYRLEKKSQNLTGKTLVYYFAIWKNMMGKA